MFEVSWGHRRELICMHHYHAAPFMPTLPRHVEDTGLVLRAPHARGATFKIRLCRHVVLHRPARIVMQQRYSAQVFRSASRGLGVGAAWLRDHFSANPKPGEAAPL